jgi:hypothetical protein
LVVEHYAAVVSSFKLRRVGLKPTLTEEVITMEPEEEFFKLHKGKDVFAYFQAPYYHLFPNRTTRTGFARQVQLSGKSKLRFKNDWWKSAIKPTHLFNQLTQCLYQFALTSELIATNALQTKPILWFQVGSQSYL